MSGFHDSGYGDGDLPTAKDSEALSSNERCPHGISLTAVPPCHFCEHDKIAEICWRIVNFSRETSAAANCVLVHRQLVGELREALQSSSSGTAPTVSDGGPAEAGHLTHETSDVARMRNTLVQAGYTDCGGELWKPPLGRRPVFLDRFEALEGSVYGAIKWLLSHDPTNAIHARDILLGAVGFTQEEFAEKYRDHIIQPPAECCCPGPLRAPFCPVHGSAPETKPEPAGDTPSEYRRSLGLPVNSTLRTGVAALVDETYVPPYAVGPTNRNPWPPGTPLSGAYETGYSHGSDDAKSSSNGRTDGG